MQSILEQITDWLKSMIISGIMGNLSGMFDSVNQQVGQIAGDVGTTPANFSPAVFSMIRNISESVILPIAGMVLTFIACYELIQMLIEHGWRFYDKDQVKIDTFCSVFGVSRSAAAIRLEQLGYLNRKKDYEYRDPLEVWP